MSDKLKELISKADRGDSGAQRELMERGDAASAAGNHEQAAYLYKMAAMAYRITGSRSNGTLFDFASRSGELSRTLRYYNNWIKKYTQPVVPRINDLKQFQGNFDRPIGLMRRGEDEYRDMLFYLEGRLMEHDVEICAPGGTINRHFYYMVQQREGYTEFMHDIDFRVVLDPICDEVLSGLEEAIYEQV